MRPLILSMIGLATVPAQQTAPEFKAETNLVLVPVVVRNSKAEVVSNLTKEDFRLFDNGKQQAIASFAVEETSGRVAEDRGQPNAKRAAGEANGTPMVIPARYVALFFDDEHFKRPVRFGEPPRGYIGGVGDLWFVRDSARKMLQTLKPADRVAVFTTTGFVTLDFTEDRSKVEAALLKLRPGDSPRNVPEQTFDTIQSCRLVIKRMAYLPGQRTLVFLSPGLQLPTEELPGALRLIDDAIRSRVVINSLDARGLSPTPLSIAGPFEEFQARVTDGTGGTYIRDTNDLNAAVERLAATPKYIYILGFSPQGVKPDGSFHRLTVKLREARNLDVQARSGYTAPGGSESTAKSSEHSVTAKAEAEAPRYSETESRELAKALDIGAPPAVAPAVKLPKASAPAANDEIVTTEQPVTFKVQTNLVEVPVVVRDRDGHAVGNLGQEDFRIFDKGKRQEIAKFAVVANQSAAAPVQPQTLEKSNSAPVPPSAIPAAAVPPLAPPTHFVTFVFDDLHMLIADIPQVRAAALKYLHTQLRPGDRVSLVTTSGRQSVDFTADPEALAGPINQIMPSPLGEKSLSGCGAYVSYFQAVQVDSEVGLHPIKTDVTKSLALRVAVSEYSDFDSAVLAIRDAYTSGLQESRITLAALKAVVRRMVTMPGQRSVVLVSPGFFIPFDLQNESDDLMAQAIRARVLISIVDARGVWTNPVFDACRDSGSGGLARLRDLEGHANTDELIAIAEDTGGSLNANNDFLGGIEKAAAAPEYRYILGFVPQDLKLDGSFHPLKVTVGSGEKLSLQARRGYWAPKHAEDEVSVSKQEIQDAVFSRDETHGLAAEMHTNLTKTGDQAKLSVLTSLDLKSISLRKVDGRNRNDVTIVAALFDTNGNFLEGTQKLVELRLLDQTVAGLPQKPPVVISTDFKVKPGDYLVRLVVRDAEERQVTAENAGVRVQ
ncbi:MAG TPA: VWA domain-containing protein [Bryobacteraceae bacterium]|nr:VWA domain-containing protein [Bryobacteraceae bacterium]